MGIAAEIGGHLHWSLDRIHIWHPPVAQGDEADILLGDEQQQREEEDEQQIPIPPMPARTIIRQIPPTPQYMAESIHLLREMHIMQQQQHEMQRWSMDTLHTIAWRQGYHLTPRPVLGPFVPQPWTHDAADPQPSGTHDAADPQPSGTHDDTDPPL